MKIVVIVAVILLRRPIALGLVGLYRLTLSRLIGVLMPETCRFHPTCGAYAFEAFRAHGFLRASWLTFRRLMRCHPWGGVGDDPVPDPTSGLKLPAAAERFFAPGRLTGVSLIHDHREHLCFSAALDGRPVWGKIYTSLGSRKGLFSRPFLPAYNRATIAGIRLMKDAGLPTPDIVYDYTCRVLGLPVRSIIITTWVDGIESALTSLGRTDDPASRERLVRQWGAFAARLHRAGIFHFKKRYFHTGPAGFMLFDLDKVLPWPGAPPWMKRHLARHDLKGIREAVARTAPGDLSALEDSYAAEMKRTGEGLVKPR